MDLPSTEASTDPSLPPLHRATTARRAHRARLGADGVTVFYYAHLDRYAAGLKEGQAVQQGTVLGYVGDTGNAGKGDYHLHFAIWHVQDLRRYWEGTNINPYPLLARRRAR
jgi:murein DD-endopeptidase MepM/ murein hydrolase activator NlpD